MRKIGPARTVGFAFVVATLGAVAVPGTASAGQAPTTPTGLRVERLAVGGVTLAWNPSTDDSGWLLYEVELNALPRDLKRSAASGPAATFSNLVPGQTYTASVLAKDSERNTSAVVTTRFTVPVDTTAPTTPAGLRAVTARGALDGLEWAPSTDESRFLYVIYSGDTPLTATSVPRVSADDLVYLECVVDPGSTHTLSVQARDVNGLVSGRTSAVTVTFPR